MATGGGREPASGDAGEAAESKIRLRDDLWTALRDAGADRFPGAEGRIPNFVGAEQAAARLRRTDAWTEAGVVKANPDSPQWPARQRALEDGKRVYMAVPRLAELPAFLLLDPDALETDLREASSIKGASREGEPVPLAGMEPVDLVVVGCVGADPSGARLGKGGGYSDLEFAVLREAGLIDDGTRVATTVHEAQVVEAGRIPMRPHDVPLDLIVTPDRVVECATEHRRPRGIRWDELQDARVETIPLLRRLRGEGAGDDD